MPYKLIVRSRLVNAVYVKNTSHGIDLVDRMVAVEIEEDGRGQSERREADRADRANRFSVNAGEAEELVIPRKKRVKREE